MAKVYTNNVFNSEIHTIVKTIGCPTATGVDFNATSVADHVQQNFDLGAIIPAKSRVLQIEVVCTQIVAAASDATVVVGNVSAGAQYIVALSCDDANEVVGIINPALPQAVVPSWTAATKVWVGIDPTDSTWALMVTGKWAVYITYITYANVL
jgi:hypothetical protein